MPEFTSVDERTAMHVTYPSPELPGETKFSLDLPDGWAVSPAPGVSFIAMAPTAEVSGPSSVVASVRRIDAQVATSELVAALDAELHGIEGCTVSGGREIWIGDRSAIERRISYQDMTSGDSAAQIQLITVVAVTEEVADAVTVTATLVGADDDEAQVAAVILGSLRIGSVANDEKDG